MTDRARELLKQALSFFEEICDSRSVGIEKSINAYLAEPKVKREALTTEEIEKKYWESFGLTSWTCFVDGIRFAEKHHGIGCGDE